MPTPPMPNFLRWGDLEINGIKYVAYNSTITFSNTFTEFGAKSDSSSEAYALTHYDAIGVSYNLISGENYFGFKIISTTNIIYLFLNPPIEK